MVRGGLAPDGKKYGCFISGCLRTSNDRYEMTRHFKSQHPDHERDDVAVFFSQLKLVDAEEQELVPANDTAAPVRFSKRLLAQMENNDEVSMIVTSQKVDDSHIPKKARVSGKKRDQSPDYNTPARDIHGDEELTRVQRYKCYVCQNLFTRRDSVRKHYITVHGNRTKEYQRHRTVMVLVDAQISKAEQLPVPAELPTPSLVGISSEIRQLILKQLLTASTDSRKRSTSLCYEVFHVNKQIRAEAQNVLNKANFIIKVMIEHAGIYSGTGLEQTIFKRTRPHIDLSRLQAHLEPALTIRARTKPTTAQVCALNTHTTVFVTYNEFSFAEFVHDLCLRIPKIDFVTFTFGAHAHDSDHMKTLVGVFRYLRCIRQLKGVKVEDTSHIIDGKALERAMKVDLANPSAVFSRLRYLVSEGIASKKQERFAHAAIVFEIGWKFAHLRRGIPDGDVGAPLLWSNCLEESACIFALLVCQSLNKTFRRAYDEERLQSYDISLVRDAVYIWAERAFGFCGLSNHIRAAAHLAKAVAYSNLATYLFTTNVQAREQIRDLLIYAAENLFFCAELSTIKKAFMVEEIDRIDLSTGIKTTAESTKLARLDVHGGRWEGDPHLVSIWGLENLHNCRTFQLRPLGWTRIDHVG